MTTEKRILIASVLSAFLMVWYAQMLPKPSPKPVNSSVATPVESKETEQMYLISEEEVIPIISQAVQLELGKESGSIREVILRGFKDLSGQGILQFGGEFPVLKLFVGGAPLKYELNQVTTTKAIWVAKDSSNNNYYISLGINLDNSLLNIELSSINPLDNYSGYLPVSIFSSWTKGDALGDRYNQLQIIALTNKEHQFQREYLTYYKSYQRRNVPRGTRLITLSDRYFCYSLNTEHYDARATILPSNKGAISVQTTFRVPVDPDGRVRFSTTAYLGTRDYASMKKVRFERAFPIGVLGKIGLVLLVMLSGIATLVHNYGLAIVLFSVIITCALAPFTLLSFKSMKKMRELKPQMDRIMAQHKNDTQKANIEMLALYKAHKVSPLSGCLPMMLQFPILMALFQSISHFFELRGQSFFWIKDLSLPDRIATLPFTLPIIGRDVNVLPLVMAVVMFFQTKLSQQQMPSQEQNPMANVMAGPMMPVLFGIMFYQFPAGLVLYWLTNSVTSLLFYRLAR